MGIGVSSIFSVSMTSGATLTSSIDLGQSWETVYLAIPSMVSGTDIYLRAGVSATDTVGYRVMHPVVNSSSAQVQTFVIASAVSGNKLIPVPGGFRYLFVEYSTATTATSHVFKVVCGN